MWTSLWKRLAHRCVGKYGDICFISSFDFYLPGDFNKFTVSVVCNLFYIEATLPQQYTDILPYKMVNAAI